MDGTEFERGTLNFLLSGIYQKSHRTVGFPGGLGGKESACDEGDRVQSLVQEDLLKKGMATHSSILACQRSLAGYSLWCCKESEMTERLTLCLENCRFGVTIQKPCFHCFPIYLP